MARILITGATGFVGANLTRHLFKKGHEIHILRRANSNFWRLEEIKGKIKKHSVDIFDYQEVERALKKIKPTVIYHLLAYGTYPFQKDDNLVVRTNILGSANLFQAAQAVPSIRMIVSTGSTSEYGYKSKPMKESDWPEPYSIYGVSKLSQSLLGQYYSKVGKVPIVTLRLFSVYGPYEEPGRLIPSVFISSIKGTPLRLSSSTTRDFVYIDDVVKALEMAAKNRNPGGEIINIGSGRDHFIGEVPALAKKLFQVNFSIKRGPGRSFDRKIMWRADIRKAKRLLGWRPRYTLEAGLKKSWPWYKQNIRFYEAHYRNR